MDQYIARQPIFTVHQKVYAYELLYRGKGDYALDLVNGEQATTRLLNSAFLFEDILEIANHRPCFINFTQNLLEKMIPLSFPKDQVVIEILEHVEPTPKLLKACQKLKDEGYILALDDFIYNKKYDPLLELADIVKIDFRLTPVDTIVRSLHHISRFKVRLLAEKVETMKEFNSASKMGFRYFQGYFFSRPETIRIKELTSNRITQIQLLSEVSKKSTTIEKLHDIITNDVSISFKLLRFLNSSYYSRLQEVTSVKNAIAYMGEKELRHFVMLVIISEMASEKPLELIRQGLIRAKFCELLGEKSKSETDPEELFLMGLFSLLDVMLDVDMHTLLKKLPLSDWMKLVLLSNSGTNAVYLQFAKAYELLEENTIEPLRKNLNLDRETVNACYLMAVKFANGLTG